MARAACVMCTLAYEAPQLKQKMSLCSGGRQSVGAHKTLPAQSYDTQLHGPAHADRAQRTTLNQLGLMATTALDSWPRVEMSDRMKNGLGNNI
jgi:hypothetical protein